MEKNTWITASAEGNSCVEVMWFEEAEKSFTQNGHTQDTTE